MGHPSRKVGHIKKFTNCRILRNKKLIEEDILVRNGRIIDPLHLFYYEKKAPDEVIDCNGGIIAPGFIDIQINGENCIGSVLEIREMRK